MYQDQAPISIFLLNELSKYIRNIHVYVRRHSTVVPVTGVKVKTRPVSRDAGMSSVR